jgi:hypothetical protein
MNLVQSLSAKTGGTMRLSWAQGVAGVLTIAVVVGLLLLPGRLIGPDRLASVAVPQRQAAVSVQAAPPLEIRHLQRPKAKTSLVPAPRSYAYVARPRVVVQASAGKKLLKAHRSAVIRKLAPTAPLVRARVLAAVAVPQPHARPVTSNAKTIAALAAGLSKK